MLGPSQGGLSCIHEEDSSEEPLDEKLFRLQSRVTSMLESQKRQEPKQRRDVARKHLAQHYRQQLERLEDEERELQHQMMIRQQLRRELHEEEQQAAAQVEVKPEDLVAENRQLDQLRRQLEEQLRVSEQRRLELERENQLLQRQTVAPSPHAQHAWTERCYERHERPAERPVESHEWPTRGDGRQRPTLAEVERRILRPRKPSPPRWQSAARPPQVAQTARGVPGVPKFQHPRPAKPLPRSAGRLKASGAPGSTPEDGLHGSLSARLPSPTREPLEVKHSSSQQNAVGMI